jgi:cyclopropane-fatty-acyl-phospholipid synthase
LPANIVGTGAGRARYRVGHICDADRSIGASMDRLLRYVLQHFIRRGTMIFTTARGMTFTCGDGTGQPVKARFTTARAARRILFNPELALGEAWMDGTFVVENGSIADVLAISE